MEQVQQNTPWWRRWWMIIIWVILAMVVVVVMIASNSTSTGTNRSRHVDPFTGRSDCYGYPYTIGRTIKNQLKDPDSFRWATIEGYRGPAGKSIVIIPPDENKHSHFVARYRAKNSFGAYTIGEAVGYVNYNDCRVHLTSID